MLKTGFPLFEAGFLEAPQSWRIAEVYHLLNAN